MKKQTTLEEWKPAFLPIIRVEIHRNEQDEDFFFAEEQDEMKAIISDLKNDFRSRIVTEYEENAFEKGFVLRVFREVATVKQNFDAGKEQARRELVQSNRIGHRWEDEDGVWYGHGKVIVK